MSEAVIRAFGAILIDHPWVAELAGILPLSALIDFIDIPTKLHIFQLTGAVPLWSWPITPSGSRLLLASSETEFSAHLDRFGNSLALTALDGRYGDRYLINSPETLRLCLKAHGTHIIENHHKNMQTYTKGSTKDHGLRIQNLEVIHVSRLGRKHPCEPEDYWLRRLFFEPWWMFSSRYLAISALGWMFVIVMAVISGILECYLSLAFTILIPATGCVVFLIHGKTGRYLLVESSSSYNRLVVVTEHMNTVDWLVFYGESTIVNSLLNRPLVPIGPTISSTMSQSLRMLLRAFILGQWGLVLAAAATKNFNAYFITTWIVFSVLTHTYFIPPSTAANDWLRNCVNIRLQRYQTKLSSRRALLNTVIALNPDTFAILEGTKQEDRTKFHESAMKWLDPILEKGPSRWRWSQATREALNFAARFTPDESASETWLGTDGELIDPAWVLKYQKKGDYWRPFVSEGIHMAEKIKQVAGLSGRIVDISSEKLGVV